MGLNKVFKSGTTEIATDISGNSQSALSNKRSGPVLDNRQKTDFANLNLSDIDRDFNKNRDEATILSFEQSERSEYEDDSLLMDTMIDTALEKAQKRTRSKFYI